MTYELYDRIYINNPLTGNITPAYVIHDHGVWVEVIADGVFITVRLDLVASTYAYIVQLALEVES